VGQWSDNDFIVFDRKDVSKFGQIKQPLYCNALCTDLIPLPGFHPVTFPYYLSKTMRSLNLIDFKTQQAFTVLETRDIPVDCFAYKKMAVTNSLDGRLKVIYVTSDCQMKNTIVEEVIIGRLFLKGLHVATNGQPS
jgi:hypothetical protein